MAYDIARKGSQGNRSLLSKYGGSPGSGPGARNKYASGGAVKAYAFGGNADDDNDDAPTVEADGEASAKRLDRPGRKMKGKDKGKDGKGKTDINIVIMAGKDGPPGPIPPMPMAGPPGPSAGPPMPPPSPMPMQASGGRVGRASGGKVKKADGGPVADYLREQGKKKKGEAAKSAIRAVGEGVLASIPEFGRPARALLGGASAMGVGDTVSKYLDGRDMTRAADKWDKTGLPGRPERATGGVVKAAGQDTSSEKESQRAAMIGRASGGKVPHMKDGAGGGMGRLEKIKKYGV